MILLIIFILGILVLLALLLTKTSDNTRKVLKEFCKIECKSAGKER